MTQWVDFRLLKRGLSIEQVLASYRIPLERVGNHQLRGRCPLPTHRSEQSRQSFSVNTAKNVWACHSASCCEMRQGRVGGNVLDLVAVLEGCSIRDAALRLQDEWCGWRAGIEVGRQQLASKGNLPSSSPDRPPPLTFSVCMRWHPYLEQRGVQRATATRFGVGYYGGSGFLRHRIVFPIHDSEGRLVAYAGRSFDGSEPRYLFPPGFRKSQVVFNLHRAIGEAAAECAIVVEGFFDCLRVHQAGYRNVVALMGVSLSEMQEKMLLERFPQLILMLDGDEAGQRARPQLVERLAGRVSVAVTEMASGWQPDQLSNEEISRILHRASSRLRAP
jgi:DNA primase